jgi:hypothetical protein
MTKFMNKFGIKGSYSDIIKAIYGRPIVSITQMIKYENISSKVKNKTKVSTLTILIIFDTRSFSQDDYAIEKKVYN